MDDLGAIWMGSGVELARRIEALAGEWELLGTTARPWETLREVLNCDYNPLPDRLPELGDPPTLRPAVPAAPEPGS